MVESTFLIPMTKNKSSKKHPKELWDKFHDELRDTFGGFTKDTVVYGQWKNSNGETVEDYSQKYTIAIDLDRKLELREMLFKYKLLFKQECIYLSILGQVYFI